MREVAWRGYQYGTWVMLVLIVVQFAAAGAGLFSILSPPQAPTGLSILFYHANVGPLFVFILSVLMIILGFVGRMPWRMTGLAAAFIPLLTLQSIFIMPYKYPNSIPALSGMPWLSALHVLNGLFIFWLTFQWPDWTRRDLTSMRQSAK